MIALEGVKKEKEESKYTIYTINSTNDYVIVPNNETGTLEFIVDLSKGSINQNLNEISGKYTQISTEHPNSILIIPILNENTVNLMDKQNLFNRKEKIMNVVNKLYLELTTKNVNVKVNNKIKIIEEKPEDETFVNWFKEQLREGGFNPNTVEGIKLAPKEESNVLAGNNIFGIANEEAKVEAPAPAPQTNDIFAQPATTTPAQEQPTASVSPVPETPTPQANDVFGAPTEKKEEPAPIPAPVATEQVQEAPQATNLFATPQASTAEPAPIPAPVATEPVQAPQATNLFTAPQAPTAEPAPAPTVQEPVAPTPVQDKVLDDGTTTFSPIPNTPEQTAAPQQENANVKTLTRKKSGGFVNLAILLVVLVIVTIISIELGKFLYSVYGA